MMHEQLRRRLRDDAALAALQADRVYWNTRPQGSALPATVLSIVSDPEPQTYADVQPMRRTLVQADLVARSAIELAQMEEAFCNAIRGTAQVDGVKFRRAFIRDRRDRSQDGVPDYRHVLQIDFQVWHSA